MGLAGIEMFSSLIRNTECAFCQNVGYNCNNGDRNDQDQQYLALDTLDNAGEESRNHCEHDAQDNQNVAPIQVQIGTGCRIASLEVGLDATYLEVEPASDTDGDQSEDAEYPF